MPTVTGKVYKTWSKEDNYVIKMVTITQGKHFELNNTIFRLMFIYPLDENSVNLQTVCIGIVNMHDKSLRSLSGWFFLETGCIPTYNWATQPTTHYSEKVASVVLYK